MRTATPIIPPTRTYELAVQSGVRMKHCTKVGIKGTLARSGMCRQVLYRPQRRFGDIYMRLGIRVRGLQPKSVFRGCTIVEANLRETRAF